MEYALWVVGFFVCLYLVTEFRDLRGRLVDIKNGLRDVSNKLEELEAETIRRNHFE